MDPDCAAAAAGHEQLPEHATVALPSLATVTLSLVNLTRMYPVVDVQLRLDEILLPLSDASSELDLHDVAPSDDEQL
jgi:hypothetical protein